MSADLMQINKRHKELQEEYSKNERPLTFDSFLTAKIIELEGRLAKMQDYFDEMPSPPDFEDEDES